MNISNFYWYFPSALTPRFCDEVIKYAKSQKETMGLTGGYGDKKLNREEIKNLQKKRKSDLVWLNDNWIYKELHPYVREANKNAGWNYDWERSESCQFTKYKLNQFYDWHQDAYDKVYPENYGSNQAGKIRKLSIIVTLVDGSEYDGGDLQMNFRHKHKIDEIKTINEIRPKGSVIVFPSYIFHRVTPVTRGTRYSLVNWNLGYPYR